MSGTSTLEAIRRYWWLVAAIFVGGVLVGGLPSPSQSADAAAQFTASHTILVSSMSSSNSIVTDPLAFNQLTLFVTTGEVPVLAAKKLDYKGSPAQLAEQVKVEADPDSGAIRITTVQPTAERAALVADTFGDELISYLNERQDSARQDRLAASLEQIQALESQMSAAEDANRLNPNDPVAKAQLDALSRQYSVVFESYNALVADNGNQLMLTTLEKAQPLPVTSAGLSAPRSRVSRAILGGLVGGALGIGVALVLARLDRRLRTREQVESVLGIPTQVTIPQVSDHRTTEFAVGPGQHDPLADSYRTLRSIIAFLDAGHERQSNEGSITLVISPGPGEGKTTVTTNLSLAFSEAGDNTIVVNTDFRRPTLAKRLGVNQPKPVNMPIADLNQSPLSELVSSPPGTGLKLLDLSGLRKHNPGDLARATVRLMPRLTKAAKRVIIDSSPIAGTAEVLEFVPLADTIVIVVQLGATSISAARRTIEIVQTLAHGDLVLAVIGNDKSATTYYYYSHSAGETEPGTLERLRAALTGKSPRNKPAPRQPAQGRPVAAPAAPATMAPSAPAAVGYGSTNGAGVAHIPVAEEVAADAVFVPASVEEADYADPTDPLAFAVEVEGDIDQADDLFDNNGVS